MGLNHMQYESIIRGYELLQDHNRHLLEERKEEIYRTIPEFQEAVDAVSTCSLEAVKALLGGNEEAPKQLHQKIEELNEKKKALLLSHQYPVDYLDPIYRCNLCQDTGYLISESGKKEKCQCFRRQELSLLYKQSNIQSLIEKENFSTLSYEFYQGEDLQHFEAAVKICQNFVKNFKQDYHNLFFYGTVGVGKSFLSGCIAKEILQTGYSVIYFSSSALFDTLSGFVFDKKPKEELQAFYDDLYTCDLLILDDLGTEVTNTFVASQLFSCINERSLRQNATIISTNLTLGELRDRYSDRIFSRISSSYTLCKLTGPDIRIYKKKQNMAGKMQ